MATVVTPDEPVPINSSDKEYAAFEKDIANFTANVGDGSPIVTHDAKVPGKKSLIPRQVDVLVEGTVHGVPQTIAIECKKYGRPVDVAVVDSFIGMLLDVEADSGVLYVFESVTEAARTRAANAANPKVLLRDQARHFVGFEPEWSPELVDDLVGWDCPNENCIMGSISWGGFPQSDSRITPLAGYCDSCGTLAIMCGECEEIEIVHGGVYTCLGCGSLYDVELGYPDQNLENVVLLRFGE